MKLVTCFGVWCSLLVTVPGSSQLAQIDAAKLPQTAEVQSAYKKASEVERYARDWTDQWRYDVPKAEVAQTLTSSLGVLQKAATGAGVNHELQLATGVVAHLAYNVDVEAAYDPAVSFLTQAADNSPGDFRGKWFLGIHECQSLHVEDGMNRLLSVEETEKKLPNDFWDDYIACANTAILPAHAMRAIERAVEAGQPRERYRTTAEIANDRYKSADLSKPVSQHDAWSARKLKDGRINFTSRLCGFSFLAHGDWGMGLRDVANGICLVTLEPPAKKGQASATVLLLVRSPKAGESLEDFARSSLGGRVDGVSTLISEPCPVNRCVGFDVVAKDLYTREGGGHLLITALESDEPRYDGLPFERPQGPPELKSSDKPVYLTVNPEFRRMPGRLFYLITVDSNAQIFAGAKLDWESVLKSMVVE